MLDVWRDLVGLWLGLFWCLAPRKGLFWLRAIASLLVLPTFGLILQAAAAQLNALSKFPLLAGFETALEQLPMNGDIRLSNTVVSQGRYSARVQLNGDKYSGVGISPLVRDWRGYKYLAMDIYVPDAETLTLHVRVSDVQHDRGANAYDDRFNLSIAVQAGWNHLRIPLADMRTAPTQREMNMAAISYVGLFAMQLHKARYFYWDNLYLE